MSAFYDLKAETPKEEYKFDQLKGKVVLIVNVASKCWSVPSPQTLLLDWLMAEYPDNSGFTPQYTGLQKISDTFKDQDFVLLGFPCNQFGGQEPGTDEEISSFCTLNHGVTFPLMKKSDVNGDNTNEVFKFLKNEKPGIFGLTRIKWNFEKFLVNKEGKVVERWASITTPDQIIPHIEKLLKE